MDKYGALSTGVSKLTSDLYAMEANSMLLITEKATIMPQVDDTGHIHPLDPSQTFSPPLWPITRLIPLVAESTWVPQPNIEGDFCQDAEQHAIGVHPYMLHQLPQVVIVGLMTSISLKSC